MLASAIESRLHPVAALAVLVAVTVAATGPAGGVAAPAARASNPTCDTTFHTIGGRLYPSAAENATVTGEGDWPPGTTLTVELLFPEADRRLQTETTVDEHGEFAAAFDLSGLDNRTFVATLLRDGEAIDVVEGHVGVPEATISIQNQTATDAEDTHEPDAAAAVVVRRVVLEQGGFVAVHRGAATGPIVGVSRHLGPGAHENVTVPLEAASPGSPRLVAMAHHDGDCDETFDFVATGDDGPYLTNRTDPWPVVDAAVVAVPSATPTQQGDPTPTRTTAPPPTATPADTPPPTDATPLTPTRTTTPGFAAAAAALAALATAALLAARRRP